MSLPPPSWYQTSEGFMTFGIPPAELADILLPPARKFRWEVLDTPPPLAYPEKPYQAVSVSQGKVVDRNGQCFQFTVHKGRIIQWSDQFNYVLEKPGSRVNFWATLTKKQRTRMRLKWEQRKIWAYRKQLRATRPKAILVGKFN